MLIPWFLLAPHLIPLNSVTSEEKAKQGYVCTMCCVCICIFSVCACVFCAVCTYVLCILSACVHVCACVFCAHVLYEYVLYVHAVYACVYMCILCAWVCHGAVLVWDDHEGMVVCG
jgi:hypothetical protein